MVTETFFLAVAFKVDILRNLHLATKISLTKFKSFYAPDA